jgi:hypothetical protein
MKTNKKLKILITICFLSSSLANAHPVPYKGALGIMTWNQPFLTDSWVTYSTGPNFAFAGRFMRMQMADRSTSYLYMPQANLLLKRWNETDLQANAYLYGGYGGLKADNRNGSAGLVGAEFDAENRKYYAALKYEYMNASIGENVQQTQLRLGIAPYEAEYSEVAAWFMVQAQYHPALSKKFAVTPLARIFYKSVLIETGVSLEGDWMMNFMFHL